MATPNFNLETIGGSDALSSFPTLFNNNMSIVDSKLKPTYHNFTADSGSTPAAQNTWTLLGTINLNKGFYLITVPFFRNQGGGSNEVFADSMAFKYNDSSPYSGDAMMSAVSREWGVASLAPIPKEITSDNTTVYIWGAHSSATAHKFDVRMYFIEICGY